MTVVRRKSTVFLQSLWIYAILFVIANPATCGHRDTKKCLTEEESCDCSEYPDTRDFYPDVLPSFSLSELGGILELGCALLCVPPCSPENTALLRQVARVFHEDAHVFIGTLSFTNGSSSTHQIVWKSSHNQPHTLAFYTQELRDRTCLLSPPKTNFKAEPYLGPVTPELIVQFLNEKCGAYRNIDGGLNSAGLFHSYIMRNLYHPPTNQTTSCPRIPIPDKETFFQRFLFQSRPVVIEGGISEWSAMQKWTKEYLKGLYGNKSVHIKLTKDGNFEGVESAELWSSYREDWIPEKVREQLSFPDLVVVRPATAELLFSDFLDYISSEEEESRPYSAYLEYSSIPAHFLALEEDMKEMPFLDGLLERKHLNIWLSDGNTLGKLHFDPYDNFLCQISGEKHLTLFEPHHNENLYEGHIPEAILSFDSSTGEFSRKRLLESTSMVMSPVDITSPDLERFPLFPRARRVECTLKPEDVLFMPAFWWHEVQSYPDAEKRRNLAVNYWYEPVLTKEFPCAECKMKFNSFYGHLLHSPPV